MDIFYLRIRLNKLKFKIKTFFIKNDPNIDPAYYEALEFIKGKSFITYSQLQKGLNIGYARTSNILELLRKNKKIGPKENGREKRKIKT